MKVLFTHWQKFRVRKAALAHALIGGSRNVVTLRGEWASTGVWL
jgi:hypothetical protein